MTIAVTEVIILFCACVKVVNSVGCHQSSRSSMMRLTDGKTLTGHDLQRQRTYDLMACAHSCLSLPECVSFNYENVVEGDCELKDKGVEHPGISETLTPRKGYIFGQLVNVSSEMTDPDKQSGNPIFTFTTLGAQGSSGPTSTAGYTGTTLEGAVTLDKGIQLWTILSTGSYVIQAVGASGSNGTCAEARCTGWTTGGLGASITGTFNLNKGDSLKILVGQKGERTVFTFPKMPGSGGGGTFVTDSSGSPLIIAGGGGGGGAPLPGYGNGDPGQSGELGTRSGGARGMGGNLSSVTSVYGGSGAGFYSDGMKPSAGISTVARCFIKGGKGGENTITKYHGGFGGGGFAWTHPGGGGGYSGGGIVGNQTSGYAGGGGSYNVGSDQKNEEGANKGDGKVVVYLL